MRQGSESNHFLLTPGESATVRIVGVGTSQGERVGTALERLEGDVGPGHVYRFTAGKEPGDVHLVLDFEFSEQREPPARYDITVEGSAGLPRIAAAAVAQPANGSFPQTLSQALLFTVD